MAGRRKVSGLSLQRAGSVSAVHACILQLYCVHEHDILIQIALDFSGCPPPLPAAPGRLRGRCKLGSLLPMFSAVLQEMVVLVLDVGPRMHPHLEGAARAANDFVVSKVRSGAPLRLLHCGVLPSGPCCILHFARVTFSSLISIHLLLPCSQSAAVCRCSQGSPSPHRCLPPTCPSAAASSAPRLCLQMLYKPAHELAIVLFGATDTHNHAHDETAAAGDDSQYRHIVEAHRCGRRCISTSDLQSAASRPLPPPLRLAARQTRHAPHGDPGAASAAGHRQLWWARGSHAACALSMLQAWGAKRRVPLHAAHT